MSSQAEQLQQSMSFFKLAGTAHGRAASVAIASARRAKSVARRGAPTNNAPKATAAGAAAFPEVGADAPDETHFARF
jgi:methyl-accepting chemotaxis protein